MITKKELVEKLISFTHSESEILLIDTNFTPGIVKIFLKVFLTENKNSKKIGFISSHENFFSEVFSKTQTPVKKETDYILSNHKISFYTLTTALIKTPPSNIDLFIVYPLETLDEKSVIKFLDKSKDHKKVVLISDDPEKKFKSIKKLKPTLITMQDDIQTAYYNRIRSSISSSK